MVLISDLDIWPPKFQTYQEFKDDLNNAIQQHPPFGHFVKREIIGNSEIDKIIRLPNWKNFLQNFKSVKDLKERYIEFTSKKLNRNYSEIYCAETTLNLLDNEQYTSEKKEYDVKMQNFNKFKSNGEYMTPRVKYTEPKKPEIIACKEFCEKRFEELSKDII